MKYQFTNTTLYNNDSYYVLLVQGVHYSKPQTTQEKRNYSPVGLYHKNQFNTVGTISSIKH